MLQARKQLTALIVPSADELAEACQSFALTNRQQFAAGKPPSPTTADAIARLGATAVTSCEMDVDADGDDGRQREEEGVAAFHPLLEHQHYCTWVAADSPAVRSLRGLCSWRYCRSIVDAKLHAEAEVAHVRGGV
jgi:hypothetical protein